MSDHQTPLDFKNQGNALLAENKLDEAVAAYSEGIRLLAEEDSSSSSSSSSDTPLHITLLANRAQAHLNAEKWAAAESDCSAALKLGTTPVTPKCLGRRAQARLGIKTAESLSGAFEDAVALADQFGAQFGRDAEGIFRELRALSAQFAIKPKLSFRHRALVRGRRGQATGFSFGAGGTTQETPYPDGTTNVYSIDMEKREKKLLTGIQLTDEEEENDTDDSPADLADKSKRVLFWGNENFLHHPFDAAFVRAGLKPVFTTEENHFVKQLSLTPQQRKELGHRAPVAAILHNGCGYPHNSEDHKKMMRAARGFIENGGFVVIVGDSRKDYLSLAGVTWDNFQYRRGSASVNERAMCRPPAGCPTSVFWKYTSLNPDTVPVEQQVYRGEIGVAVAFDFRGPGSGLLYVGDMNSDEDCVDIVTAYVAQMAQVSADLSGMRPDEGMHEKMQSMMNTAMRQQGRK